MSKITRRCGVRDIARSTHLAIHSKPNPSTSCRLGRKHLGLEPAHGVGAGGRSSTGPPRRPTMIRIVGSWASRSASLAILDSPPVRLYTDCLRRPTNRCCTLRPPRLSCRHSSAVSCQSQCIVQLAAGQQPSVRGDGRRRETPTVYGGRNGAWRGRLCFHPLGASEDSTLSRAKAVDHDQPSTHDNHCALLFGYIGQFCC